MAGTGVRDSSERKSMSSPRSLQPASKPPEEQDLAAMARKFIDNQMVIKEEKEEPASFENLPLK